MWHDSDSLAMGNSNDRRWCRRISFSERANNFCDGLSEDYCDDASECRWVDNQCTLEDTIWCRNGRISDDKGKWNDYYKQYTLNNARECWDKCKESPHCFAYEWSPAKKCNLYNAFDVVGTFDRYVYDPGCEDSSDSGFGCDDEIPDDDGWKYCRRHATDDIDWYYSSSQQWWAPSRP